MSYESYEERDEKEWVLFLCKAAPPLNFTARLFPTLDRARMHYGNACKNLFENYEDLAKKFTGPELMAAFHHFNGKPSANTSLLKGVWEPAEPPHEDVRFHREGAAAKLFALVQNVGDRVSGINLINEMEDEELYVIRLDRMTTDDGLALISTYPGQKKIVATGLVDFGKSKATEIELTEMMRDLVTSGRLKTKQDPMRIFRYYAPELGDDGFVFYPSKRHKREDHALNV